MALTYGPNLGLLVNGAQGEGHYTDFMKFLRGVDFFGMPAIKGYLTNTPPGSPADGDAYIIGAAPTGAWASQANKVARYSTTAAAWEFFTAKNGWELQTAGGTRETYRMVNGAWEIFYQEGTWTPALKFNGASVGMTTTTATGRYTKTGRQYFIQMQLIVSVKGSSTGTATIAGLPVNPTFRSALAVGWWNGLASALSPAAYTDDSLTTINLVKGPATLASNMLDTDFNSSGIGLYISGSFTI